MNKQSKNPRILMFAPFSFPPNSPEAIVNSNLLLAAIEDGWQVDVITRPEIANGYPINSLNLWANLESVIRPVAARKKSVASSSFSAFHCFCKSGHIVTGGRWAMPAVNTASELASKNHYDFIMSRALPAEAHLAALIVSKKTRIPWIANWNDPAPWDKFPKEFPGGKGKNARLGYFRSAFYQDIGATASWHTFPSERLRQYVTDYLPFDISNRSSVIPHIALRQNNQAKQKNGSFTILHAGNLVRPRIPDNFFQGINLFHNRTNPRPDISIIFISHNPDEILTAARVHGIESLVSFEPPKPYDEMPSIMSRADLLVIIEGILEEGIFLPSKFVDYVTSGRPILAISPASGTLADLLGAHGGGLAVDSRHPEKIAEALGLMYNEWNIGRLNITYNSNNLYPMFSKQTILNSYNQIFNYLKSH